MSDGAAPADARPEARETIALAAAVDRVGRFMFGDQWAVRLSPEDEHVLKDGWGGDISVTGYDEVRRRAEKTSWMRSRVEGWLASRGFVGKKFNQAMFDFRRDAGFVGDEVFDRAEFEAAIAMLDRIDPMDHWIDAAVDQELTLPFGHWEPAASRQRLDDRVPENPADDGYMEVFDLVYWIATEGHRKPCNDAQRDLAIREVIKAAEGSKQRIHGTRCSDTKNTELIPAADFGGLLPEHLRIIGPAGEGTSKDKFRDEIIDRWYRLRADKADARRNWPFWLPTENHLPHSSSAISAEVASNVRSTERAKRPGPAKGTGSYDRFDLQFCPKIQELIARGVVRSPRGAALKLINEGAICINYSTAESVAKRISKRYRNWLSEIEKTP